MIQVYKTLYRLLGKSERRRGALVLALLILVAFVEAIGVASIMPFISVLANPGVVETNPYLARFYEIFRFSSYEAFVLFLGLVFFVVLVCSLILRALGLWAQLRFSHNRNHHWGARLVGLYLKQPYEWFLNRHSSSLATNILAEVHQVVKGALFPAMEVIASSFVVVFLLALLVVVDPVLSLAAALLIGGAYALIAFGVKKKLLQIGAERKRANAARYLVVQEAFSGIKDVKIGAMENRFMRRFLKPSRLVAKHYISQGLIAQLPSLAMQGLLFGGMLLAMLYLVASRGGFQEAVPTAAVFALASYRLMPAIQKIYQGISQIRFSNASLNALSDDFANLGFAGEEASLRAAAPEDRGMRLRRGFALENVSYRYPGASRLSLDDVAFVVPALSTVGIVGSTGSGKTTLVDVILGLLPASEGRLVVDGEEVGVERLSAWRRCVGYVPQQIFLADDSIAGNIAFGFPEDEIDLPAVERAARVANLHDFVVQELPEGYATRVGERGVRLSGGQRQRIGIARALYHDPDVLIMDEATSALDNLTEKAVMEAIHNLARQKTIILIAHRLSTVKTCDSIVLLEGGRVAAQGTYDELVAGNEFFRAMARGT